MIISKKKYNELNDERIFLLKNDREASNKIIQLKNLNDQYIKAIETIDNKIIELSEKYRIANATIGGLSKGNNKLKKDKEKLEKQKKEFSMIISKMKKEMTKIKEQNEMLTLSNNEYMVENEKMKGIIDNLNKLISKKMKSSPTSEQIINYDRKQPSR